MRELVKANLIEIESIPQNDPKQPPKWREKEGGQKVEVQFNPESLKLTYANQLEQSKGGDQASGNAGRQFVGSGTTKLSLQLWFDVTAMQVNPVDDVRRLTQKIVYFMKAKPSEDPKDEKKMIPPGVRFSWGSFLFDGMVEGLDETIEFFSPEGKPLRASISLNLTQQKILDYKFDGDGVGQKPLTSAKAGESLQSMAAKKGRGNWQSIASANGIEDPLRLPSGLLIDLNAGITGGANIAFGVSGSQGASPGVGGSLGVSVNAGIKVKSLNASLTGSF